MAAPQPRTVLIVDDDATVRTTARAILARAGFDVQVADDGQATTALLRQVGGSVGVVILDWTLPDVTGSVVLAEVLRLAPHARVIVSTGFGREDVHLPPAASPRVTFLEKPYTAIALINAVRTILDSGPHAEESADPSMD